MENMESPRLAYVVNLAYRNDRWNHIKSEFRSKPEFELVRVEGVQKKNGALGLWLSIRGIIEASQERGDRFTLICEDDHKFTSDYSVEFFDKIVQQAEKLSADVLSGGISGYSNVLQATENLFLIEGFTGMQFTVIFNRFFKKLLDADFGLYDCADLKISQLSEKIFVSNPFISVQKNFTYSDVTSKNQLIDVENLFADCQHNLKHFVFLKDALENADTSSANSILESTENVFLQGFCLNDKILDAYLSQPKREIIARALPKKIELNSEENEWFAIQAIVSEAIENDDDVIIIFRSQFSFNLQYSRNVFFTNVIEANEQSADCLLLAARWWKNAIPISRSYQRAWIENFVGCPALVLFRRSFTKIIDQPFTGTDCDSLLSSLLHHKQLTMDFMVTGCASANEMTQYQLSQVRLSKTRCYQTSTI